MFASEITRKPKYKLFLLILLKAYQRLGYFTSMNHIPNEIKSYISNVMGIQYEEDQIEKYSKSRMKFNHMDSIRKFLDIKPYGKESRKVIIQAATEAAKIKDNDADIINIVIEELIKQKYELPAFSTLVRVSRRIRYTTYNSYYRNIYKSLNSNTIESIDSLLSEKNDTYTSWNNIKQDVGKPSVKNIKVVISYLNLLKTIEIDTNILTKVPDIKIKHFVNEAKSLDSSKMKELKASKRYTLAICFLKQRLASTLDDIGEIFIKLIKNAQNKSKDKLAKYKLEQSKTTDNLISTLKSFIITYKIEETDDKKINALMQLMENKNLDDLLEKCETHEKYSDNNYWPFLWNSLKGKRSVLFHILNEIQLCSTTQNNSIEKAIKFIKKYKNANRLDTISTTDKEIGRLDLSWVKEPWWRILTGYTNKNKYPEKINRRHFEAYVMYQIMHDLKSGDLCIKNSDIYSDYRDQVISWEEYNNNIDTFGNQVGLPVLENEFIQHLKDNMEKAIFNADNSFPENQYLKIKNGVPILSKIKKKDEPKDLKVIQNLIAENLETVNILDILSDTEKWIQWTNQFGSISGFDSKIKDKIEKYLMTTFCYGCNLGPSQTSKSLQEISRKQLSWINKRHVTEEKLEKTIKNGSIIFSVGEN
ncbi:DUF4158 domain-containing protein [Tepidibacter thalassicus]|nr:DUF4158 domain-containing protein [Tepidibacter thalassicus]